MKFELNFRNNRGTDQELLGDMNRVASKLGVTKLVSREYDENGKFSSKQIEKRFGSWNKALVKAGLEITVMSNIPKKELFENLEEVWVKLGRQPGHREMKRPLSKYSERGYVNTFGSWRKALEAFVEYMNTDVEELPAIEPTPEAVKETEAVYKHKTKREPSLRLKVQVLMRDGNKCRLCGVTVTGDNIHFDHIKPWSKGGETTLENLQVLCEEHNLGKGDLEYT
jgi:5-methylcytosine-specific restriction endonuclease McrA